MIRPLLLLVCTLAGGTVLAEDSPPLLTHSRDWVNSRIASMLAVDDAYIWHDVLGGRAIHQNSSTNPPTTPLEGNFHTQQQSKFALVKMSIYDLGGRTEKRHLDDARDLLTWVVLNGWDPGQRQFYLKYNERSQQWDRGFHPEFNMINVAGLLRYNTYRSEPTFVEAAENVLAHIVETDSFRADAPKALYTTGYLALMMLEAYEATHEQRFLDWARQLVDLGHEAMWDEEFGGWFHAGYPGVEVPKHTTKFTHTNSNMAQACLRLYLHGQGERFRERGLAAMDFLGKHLRSPDGGWYRHTNRDGSDPTVPPIVGDGGTTEPGTPCVYDRMAQMIVACCLAYRATADRKYLTWIDETLDKMERTHLLTYPAGVNYGYMGKDWAQNTWCHLWGLKAMIAVAQLWQDEG
ncbi:MAG: AGE family epimerase/isomerase [Armatimonadetes bacterium]|nr:AGE family epimerase/isomerase [Armatimonadota bacterium]